MSATENIVDEFVRRAVAFDTETWLVAPGLIAPPLVCSSRAFVSAVDGQIETRLLEKEETRRWFKGVLGEGTILVGADIAYDMLVMAADAERQGEDLLPLIFEKYERGEVYDVLVAQALDDIARGTLLRESDGSPLYYTGTKKPVKRYSLDIVTRLVLGREDAKARDFWRLRYAILDGIPVSLWPEEARQYPLDDAKNTLEVALAQVGYLPRGLPDGKRRPAENLHDLPNQVYTAWERHLSSAWGLRTDPDAVRELANRVGSDRAARVAQFVEAGLLRENGTKDLKAIQAAVSAAYKRAGATVPLTETGRVQTSRDALANSGDELLEAFAAYGEDEKILSTYLPLLERAAVAPEIPHVNILLKSGRMSYDDVWQLFPREGGVRDCFVPRPGYLYVSCDYTGLELATHAQSCLWTVGYSKLAEALNNDVAVHDAMGARMLGIGYEEFLARRKAGDQQAKDFRQAAKSANFGFPGGMGAYKLVLQQRKQGPDTIGSDGRKYKGLRFCVLVAGAQRCGEEMITSWKGREYPPACRKCVEVAEDIRGVWLKQWPENEEYFALVAKQADWNGFITQHVSRRVRGGVTFTEAANGYFQGLAADGAKLAARRVTKEAYLDQSSPLYGSRITLFIHDELFGEVPEARAHEAAMRLSEVMVGAMKEYVPDVKIEAEPALMRRWLKGAEPRYVNGRLVPWEPE